MCGNFGGGLKEAWFSYGLVAFRRQEKLYIYDLTNVCLQGGHYKRLIWA